MSDPNLLQRMQHGRTQNANECLNSLIWSRCPKPVHVGAQHIHAVAASAVSHFNQGCAHLSQVMKYLDVTPTVVLQAYQEVQNSRRCKHAEYLAKSETKQHHREKKMSKKLKTCIYGHGST